MTDEPAPATLTVRSRLAAAGLADERHHAAGRARVDGERVEDLDQAAPVPARIVFAVE